MAAMWISRTREEVAAMYMSEVTRRNRSTRRKISTTPGSGAWSRRRISTPAQSTRPAVSEAEEKAIREARYRSCGVCVSDYSGG